MNCTKELMKIVAPIFNFQFIIFERYITNIRYKNIYSFC